MTNLVVSALNSLVELRIFVALANGIRTPVAHGGNPKTALAWLYKQSPPPRTNENKGLEQLV